MAEDITPERAKADALLDVFLAHFDPDAPEHAYARGWDDGYDIGFIEGADAIELGF